MNAIQKYFLGSDIKAFLTSDRVNGFHHCYFPDTGGIDFDKIIPDKPYDLSDRGFGCFVNELDSDDSENEISFLNLFRIWKFNPKPLTKQGVRVKILVALFGDGENKGMRDLSEDEKLFILSENGLKAEVFACMEDFSTLLTDRNKSWLNHFNKPASPEPNFLIYGKEIKSFLKSPMILKYYYRVRADIEGINLAKLRDRELYDLRDNAFGYFVDRESGKKRLVFFDLFKIWLENNPAPCPYDAWLGKHIGEEKLLAVSEIRSFVIGGFLPSLSQDKLNKILEIINSKEEGLNSFSLGEK